MYINFGYFQLIFVSLERILFLFLKDEKKKLQEGDVLKVVFWMSVICSCERDDDESMFMDGENMVTGQMVFYVLLCKDCGTALPENM